MTPETYRCSSVEVRRASCCCGSDLAYVGMLTATSYVMLGCVCHHRVVPVGPGRVAVEVIPRGASPQISGAQP